MSRAELQGFYRRAVLKAHPDHGGTTEQFQAVQTAYAQAKKVLA
jgi:DnaJ-class molecular chaperone